MKKGFKLLKYAIVITVAFVVLLVVIFWKNDIPLSDLKKKYANDASQFVTIDEMQVHFRDEGILTDTLPIVLLHGTGASLHTWESWVKTLKNKHRVVTLDLPAYGLTGPNKTGVYSTAFYTQFLDSFLAKRLISKCILGGNSLGGGIAWQYALLHSDKVATLILVDAAGYPMQSKSVPLAFQLAAMPVLSNVLQSVTPRFIVKNSLLNVYVHDDEVTDLLIDRYYELALREGNRKAFIDRIKLRNFGEKDSNYLKINGLNMPTLILWGGGDELIPPSVGERFHDDLPNDTLFILENLGHTPMEEDAEKTVQIVINFLKRKM